MPAVNASNLEEVATRFGEINLDETNTVSVASAKSTRFRNVCFGRGWFEVSSAMFCTPA